MTRGLVLGKFLPPHRGHQFLIERARAGCDQLTVLACSLAGEEIPGAVRAGWMREIATGCRVVPVTDENPQQPADHPDFWDIWVATVRRAHPEPLDLVFTSEDYGDELARRLGARHVLVDRDRVQVPVSGTAVRARPLAHWEFLPECVRPWFVKRVVITGPESTGKTTLARDLAAHYGTVWVPEYARAYLDVKNAGLPPDAPICVPGDLLPIAAGQRASEEALARQADRILFCDTDPVVTCVYGDHYFGEVPAALAAEADAACRQYDLHLLLDVDVPWVSDPQRDRPHLREEMHGLFRSALEVRRLRYVPLSGTWAERLGKAIAVVDPLRHEDR